MPVSRNIRACISMSMKKTSLAGNPCMYPSMQRGNSPLMQINESCWCPVCLTENHICRVTDKGTSPPSIFF